MTITHRPKAGAVLTGTEYEASDAHIVASGYTLLRTATVTLTNAQIKALPTTPVQVIADPGAGSLLLPVAAVAVSEFSANDYTNVAANSWLFLEYVVSGFRASSRVPTSNWFDNFAGPGMPPFAAPFAVPHLSILNDGSDRVVADVLTGSDVDDLNGVYLIADNRGSGDFTGGNAANTLQITVYYVVVSV